jgi:uncharacterized protein with PQ loop repeat
MVEVLGWFGAALSCLLSIPQAVRVLRADRLDGISAATYWIVLIYAAVWALWSLLAGEHAAGVPALINGPAAILILRRLVIARAASGCVSFLGADVTVYDIRHPRRLSGRERRASRKAAEGLPTVEPHELVRT